MFDDQPISNQPGTPPGNLPTGEPEDMFADTDPVATSNQVPQQAPQQGLPQDLPLVSAMDAGVLRPKGAPAQAPSQQSPAGGLGPASAPGPQPPQPSLDPNMPQQPGPMPQAMPPAPTMSGPILSRGLAMTLIILVALLIVGGGAWWIYASFIQAPALPEPAASELEIVPDPEASVQEALRQEEAVPEPENQEENVGSSISAQQQDNEILFGEQLDDDDDLLVNTTELEIGTDPQNWDSDGDELSDGNEVLIWGTDPLNPDSDGDSYLDGLEVKSGYDPLGQGRIGGPLSTSTEERVAEEEKPVSVL